MTYPDHITTNRMRCERITEAHFLPMRELHANADVMRTLGGVRTEASTRSLLEALIGEWQKDGFSLWWLWDRATDASAGHGGLRRTRVEGVNEVEIAYGFLPKFWGLGYATEIARRSVELARDVLGLPNIVCFTLTDNLASQHVMQKAGFTFEKNVVHGGMPHVFYRQVF